jgi:hypothetical protein
VVFLKEKDWPSLQSICPQDSSWKLETHSQFQLAQACMVSWKQIPFVLLVNVKRTFEMSLNTAGDFSGRQLSLQV